MRPDVQQLLEKLAKTAESLSALPVPVKLATIYRDLEIDAFFVLASRNGGLTATPIDVADLPHFGPFLQ